MDNWEYDDIANALRAVRVEIAVWYDSEDFFDGDPGYQRLLERENELLERLQECA